MATSTPLASADVTGSWLNQLALLVSSNSGQFSLELFTLQKINIHWPERTTEQNKQVCGLASGSQNEPGWGGEGGREKRVRGPLWQILLDHPAELCYQSALPVAKALVGPRCFFNGKEILQLMSELMPAGKSKLHLKGIYLFIF